MHLQVSISNCDTLFSEANGCFSPTNIVLLLRLNHNDRGQQGQ